MKRTVSGIMLILLVFSALILLFNIQQVTATKIIVPDDYPTIQEAINNADHGDMILVCEGTYYENVIVNKTVSIIGDNRTSTIIDGGGGESVVYIKADSVTISGFTLQNGYSGIWLFYSQNCSISENNAIDNAYGIKLYHSSNSTIRGNVVRNSEWFGIALYYSSKCTLRGNTLVDNNFNFGVDGATLHDFVNNIDITNTVNGKPIYYLINQDSLVIDSTTFQEVGYLAFVNSTDIIVKDVTLTRNVQGLLFAYTSNSTTNNITTAYNWNGIYLKGSSNCQISRNQVRSNYDYGIALRLSRNCTINRNNITNNNWGGISLGSSHNCTVVGNNINSSYYGIHLVDSTDCIAVGNNVSNENNGYSIVIYRSYGNLIFHNNFMNHFIYEIGKKNNVWNNEIEGNYWGEYNGTDLNRGPDQNEPGSDGIGDMAHIIDGDNQDNYPLMGAFSDFNATSEHHVYTICNTSITDFQFDGTAITFNVSFGNGAIGFCRICIPIALMNETYKLFVNGTEGTCTQLSCSNSTHSYLYFTYDYPTQEIVIIPEFASTLILLIFMIATLLAVIVYMRKHSRIM